MGMGVLASYLYLYKMGWVVWGGGGEGEHTSPGGASRMKFEVVSIVSASGIVFLDGVFFVFL